MNIPTLQQQPPLRRSIENIDHNEESPQHLQASNLRLSEFKNNIEISKERLVELVDRGVFTEEAQEFNHKAVELAFEGYIAEAGILLGQAQKILEYAANRGKQISRHLIVTVLHNQAFCHQQSWQLDRCSNYIQALIYNLNCQIKQDESGVQQGLIVTDSMQQRSQLTHYYLLYCAINSQLKRNDGALIAAKRANSLLRQNSSILYRLATKSRAEVEDSTILLLKELKSLQCSSQNVSVQHLLEGVVRFHHIWKNKCKFPNHQLRNLVQKMSQFSIGNIMQMQPAQYVEGKNFNIDFSHEKILQRVINISVSYFTMATELRLLAFKSAGSKQAGEKTGQYRQSECYHLYSILLVLYYLPFELVYLKHIIASFKTHYHIDIQELESSDLSLEDNPQEMFYSLLINRHKEDEIKNSTAGNSQKGTSSGRNSFHDGRQSYLNKLECYVRASLKKQQHSKDMAKLNNYYYMKGELEESKEKVIQKKANRSSHGDLRSNMKKACLTSKHSVNKTPINFKSNEGSPKKSKSKCSSRSSKLGSKIGSIDHTMLGKYKKSPVMEQYFEKQKSRQKKVKKLRSKSKKKTSSSKQNGDYLTFAKPKQAVSPQNHSWKAKNIINRQTIQSFKSRENINIHTIKSTSTSKNTRKLGECKSKRKVVYYKQ